MIELYIIANEIIIKLIISVFFDKIESRCLVTITFYFIEIFETQNIID